MIDPGACRGSIMRPVACVWLMATVVASCGQPGQQKVNFFDEERARLLEVRIWEGEGTEQKPLIVLSHGAGGHNLELSWLAESLVAKGYIVVSVNHPGSTLGNDTPEGTVRLWDRPGDLSYVLTQLLSDPGWAAKIDENRVGAAGYSAGGYAVIALAGAIFDPTLLFAYCVGARQERTCELIEGVEVDWADAKDLYLDERIRAAFAMAPPIGPGFDAAGLNGIAIPVHIVATADDEYLPPNPNARHFAQHITGAELSMYPTGGHTVFMTCDWRIYAVDLFLTELDLCGRDSEADREAIQAQVSNEALAFFDRYLAVSR